MAVRFSNFLIGAGSPSPAEDAGPKAEPGNLGWFSGGAPVSGGTWPPGAACSGAALRSQAEPGNSGLVRGGAPVSVASGRNLMVAPWRK